MPTSIELIGKMSENGWVVICPGESHKMGGEQAARPPNRDGPDRPHGVPCVSIARSEVPREELESEDPACLPDISHHARTGLACNERHEPLGAMFAHYTQK